MARHLLNSDAADMLWLALGARLEKGFSSRFSKYNEVLWSAVDTFRASHPDITTLKFSAYDTFTRLLDSPDQYGFTKQDAREPFMGIWMDLIHPTTRVHDILAREIAAFLENQKAIQAPDASIVSDIA